MTPNQGVLATTGALARDKTLVGSRAVSGQGKLLSRINKRELMHNKSRRKTPQPAHPSTRCSWLCTASERVPSRAEVREMGKKKKSSFSQSLRERRHPWSSAGHSGADGAKPGRVGCQGEAANPSKMHKGKGDRPKQLPAGLEENQGGNGWGET